MARDVTELDDDALEAAFEAAKAELESPNTAIEEQYEDNSADDEDEDEFELEQPDEDSDDDTSDDEEIDDDDSEDPEEEEGEPDEEPDADEGKSDEDVEKADDDKSQPTQAELDSFLSTVSKTRANGVEYEFTNSEKLAMFDKMFPQATDYTKKMQQIKPWRKTIDAIEQAKLGQNDVNLMIDVLKGDKDAIAAVLKRTGVDALDLDIDNSDYVAKDYGRNDTELNIKDIVDEISGDPEYRVTHNVINKQWDEKSVEAFVEDPNMIRLLHTDVKSGVFDQVSPIANKLKIYDGGTKSDLDYYKMAAQQYFTRQKEQQTQAVADSTASAEAERVAAEKSRIENVKATQAKRSATKSDSAKRKAATPTKKGGGTQKKVTDYLDDSDEAFEDWYNKVQESH